jgi:hypothetical protein
MKIQKLSDEKVEDLFEEAFEEKAKLFDITEFDVKCKRENLKDDFTIEVTVIGMAGAPTIDDFKNNKIKEARKIEIDFDGEVSKFKLLHKDTVFLNSND